MEKIEAIYRKWGTGKRNIFMGLSGVAGAFLYLILRHVAGGIPKIPAFLICLIVAQIAGAFVLNSLFLKDITRFEVILTKDCDSRTFLAEVEKGLSYGEKRHLKGLQMSVYRGFQQLYLSALDAEEQYAAAEDYLENRMPFGKNSRPYAAHKAACLWDRKTHEFLTHREKAIDKKELEALYQTIRKTSKTQTEQPYVDALYHYLSGENAQAEQSLLAYTPRSPYGQVQKQVLLAHLFDEAGKREEEKVCLTYVAKKGGTLPEAQRARRKLEKYGNLLP